MQAIPESELIINPDGSIYHLNLRPEQIADTIITVGDPDRVAMVSKYFDKIEHQVAKREFITHTGWVGAKRISVISSGIGTDNIDIVINELDALVNIDFKERKPNPQKKILNFIRVGTSGCLQEDIPIDSMLLSVYGVGLDSLLHYYEYQNTLAEATLFDELSDFMKHTGKLLVTPYIFECSKLLREELKKGLQEGMTLTSPGFYAPQGRQLRAKTRFNLDLIKKLRNFEYQDLRLSNFEMETAAIYGLSKILGHRALSCNVLIANRFNGKFSKEPKKAVEKLIQTVLENISASEEL